MRTTCLVTFLCLTGVVFSGPAFGVFSEHDDAELDLNRRKTAVTLNYCRAALHRIRRAPSKQVVMEEQQRILNNLNLNQIDDPEVITLYRSILDEIGQIEISEKERQVIDEQFRRGLQRRLGTDIFVIGAQVATGQIGSVIQTGASSWWDYRTTEVKRNADLWQVEKTQFSTLMTRSSTFLDSFWKLSRKNEIPDRWLLRDQDLDQLADVLTEPDAERRLRMLGRLEKFMECYPPYWYYVARTQQQLGQLESACETFHRLAEIGSGHFRQDDMLASTMANLALIHEMKGDAQAVDLALSAMDFSSRNWESNLAAAWVLGRHRRFPEAEDLILCNLDYDLELDQSSVALVSLYFHSEDRARLAEVLDDDQILTRIPVPGLLLCARQLGADAFPKRAESFLASTIHATRRHSARMNSISVTAAPGWKLGDADAKIAAGTVLFRSVGFRPTVRGVEVNFVPQDESLADDGEEGPLRLTLSYPQMPVIRVMLLPEIEDREQTVPTGIAVRRSPIFGGSFPGTGALSAPRSYRIGEIDVDGMRLSLRPKAEPDSAGEEQRVLKPDYSGDVSATRS